MPKIFRLTSGGKLIEGIFKGETINTPSMLCVEDALDGLRWAESVGGLRWADRAHARPTWPRSRAGSRGADWVDFLAEDAATRSCTSICLKLRLVHRRRRQAAAIAALLEQEGVAYDIAAYRDAPPGLRIWGGATVETADIEALLPWLDWAHDVAAAG